MALTKKTDSSRKIKNFDKNRIEDAKPTGVANLRIISYKKLS